MAEVRAERPDEAEGGEQFFLLRAEGDDRVWHTRQFTFRTRERKPVLVPYWFEAGKTWHVWAGAERKESPPITSFATMAQVKEYIGGLVDRAAG
ncbi:hypothetical protein AB0M39_40940 [Streptomyces sp. NPDC051907]|uniref:hypothetical protein n=1 Tax=Streptomyces sp. NPDC051907 TaxID=3155284 RepID=UPI0034449D0C